MNPIIVESGSQSSTESGEDDDIPNALVSEIVDVVDRLYKFATRIRDPRARLGSSKDQRYRVVDPSSADVRRIFINARSSHNDSGRTHRGHSDSGLIPIPVLLSVADEILIERLAEANTLRRRRLWGAKRHHI